MVGAAAKDGGKSNATAIGSGADASGSDAGVVAVGLNAKATGIEAATALGANTVASGDDSLALGGGNGAGTGAAATGGGSIAIGVLSKSSGTWLDRHRHEFRSGTAPSAAGDNSVVFGNGSSSRWLRPGGRYRQCDLRLGCDDAMAIGTGAKAVGGAGGIAIGR